MVLANAEARYEAQHEDAPYHDGTFTEWSTERNALHPFHYRDGVRVWVHTVDYSDPADNFLSSNGGDGEVDEGPEAGDNASDGK